MKHKTKFTCYEVSHRQCAHAWKSSARRIYFNEFEKLVSRNYAADSYKFFGAVSVIQKTKATTICNSNWFVFFLQRSPFFIENFITKIFIFFFYFTFYFFLIFIALSYTAVVVMPRPLTMKVYRRLISTDVHLVWIRW